jgi:hypothetical protein
MRFSKIVLPLWFISGLAALTVLPSVRDNPRLPAAFLGAALVLLIWNTLLFFSARRTGRKLELEVMLRKQHYMQAFGQGAIFLYWGWYWPTVYESFHLILAQLLFAYALDMLLSWSRRDFYVLGFGPFPIIFSINLFLWFKPDWFYLQFVLVALGVAAKEFIRWKKDGRSAHIFNPSSFPLAVFSLALIATGTTDLTWGPAIATTQFYPPHMYLVLFLIGLPGQFFFGVTLMTMSAVLTTYAFGLVYYATSGIYFFYDSYIPISVFLGMHLLFTDPATAPRTEAGRVIYGVLYGLSTVALYQMLGSAGMPTFYDKLLQVPVLNLSIKLIDRLCAWSRDAHVLNRRRHLAFMSVWAMAFAVMSARQGVGDAHPGQWVPFWRQACEDGRPYACPYLADMHLDYCADGSGWACNEAGLLHIALVRSGEDLRRTSLAGAATPFRYGCDLGFAAACRNFATLTEPPGSDLVGAPPSLKDYAIVLKGSKGQIRDRSPTSLYALACNQGWPGACESAVFSGAPGLP